MTFSALRNSDESMASPVITSDVGSKISDSERTTESHPNVLSRTDTSPSGHQRNLKHFSTFGTLEKPANCSTACVIHEPFSIQHNGGIGQRIVDADGNTIVWATDAIIAQVICRLLNG